MHSPPGPAIAHSGTKGGNTVLQQTTRAVRKALRPTSALLQVVPHKLVSACHPWCLPACVGSPYARAATPAVLPLHTSAALMKPLPSLSNTLNASISSASESVSWGRQTVGQQEGRQAE